MLNLNDIYYFAQVVDSKGFAAASRTLHVPKSTLSKRVAALEEALGARLILRTARSFALSKVGLEFYKHATAMLSEAEAAERVVRKRMAEPSGTVRVTMAMTTAQLAMPSVLSKLAASHPKIQIELHATNRFVNLVDEGFDIAVRAHYDELPDSGLVQRRLGHSPMYLVASPRYLKARGAPRQPEDLDQHEALLTQPSSAPVVWKLRNSAGGMHEVLASARYFLDEPLTLLNAAVAGLGIACLPKALCANAVETGALARVLPDWNARGATITVLTAHRRLQLPAVAATRKLLTTQLRAVMRLE
jgi:DNA-binding transcriptional LysR family regulator